MAWYTHHAPRMMVICRFTIAPRSRLGVRKVVAQEEGGGGGGLFASTADFRLKPGFS